MYKKTKVSVVKNQLFTIIIYYAVDMYSKRAHTSYLPRIEL